MDIKELVKYTKNFNVLYIEDDDLLRISTREMLENYFNIVDTASDGSKGYDKYKDYHEQTGKYYDIVITDILMPGIDGEELSRLLLDFNQNQDIIVISAKADFEQVVRLINLGVNKFIMKPIQVDELRKVFYEVALKIRRKLLKEEEFKETAEYNEILKMREEESLEKLKRKMKELEEFSSALDSSAIVAKTDIHGIVTYVNDEFCKVTGYTREELVGRPISILKSGSRSKSFYKKLWNDINSKKRYKTLFQNRRKDRSLYYVETVINPILDINGDIVEFIAVSHDMTQLMESLESIKQAEKSKEEFFVNISHEMRTPLNSILGFSSILQKRLKNDEKSAMMIQKIFETGKELEILMKSILDVRKIKENTLVLKEGYFNPIEIICNCIDKYKHLSGSKSQEFDVDIDQSLPSSLFGDSARINQVISIVLDNAIKFTPERGRIEVKVYCDTSTETLICEVNDNGIGISKENQEKIFEIRQLDGSTSRSFEGAGLGLSIAYGILKAMKGKISLKSVPNKGSLFKMEFPLKFL